MGDGAQVVGGIRSQCGRRALQGRAGGGRRICPLCRFIQHAGKEEKSGRELGAAVSELEEGGAMPQVSWVAVSGKRALVASELEEGMTVQCDWPAASELEAEEKGRRLGCGREETKDRAHMAVALSALPQD
uniref:Uncharacterized protein n=1 Tax=Oryza meridionalis TaxID=40149 RepID=A0A0E0BYT4_9ORYZ